MLSGLRQLQLSSGVVGSETVAVYGAYVTTALRHLSRMVRSVFSSYNFYYIGYSNKCGNQLNVP